MLLTQWSRIAFSLSTDANNSYGTTNRHDLTESIYIDLHENIDPFYRFHWELRIRH